MKIDDPGNAPKRSYRQSARAEAAEARAERILDVFMARMGDSWFDEIRLEDVAREAEVTVQTVIRKFGGKDGLLTALSERLHTEVTTRRAVAPGDIDAAMRVVAEDYDVIGDMVIRVLGQEDRHPALRRLTDLGRASHRGWIAQVFDQWLAPLPGPEARRALDALVVATDLYVWKLVRRDMGRSRAELMALMKRLVSAVLAELPHQPERPVEASDARR
jgi:AcrR family transcriptional regulator